MAVLAFRLLTLTLIGVTIKLSESHPVPTIDARNGLYRRRRKRALNKGRLRSCNHFKPTRTTTASRLVNGHVFSLEIAMALGAWYHVGLSLHVCPIVYVLC